jgi:hypothetical protein
MSERSQIMVMSSYGAAIEFTYSAKTPDIPYDIYYSGYWHLIGTEVDHKWNFVLYGFEPDDLHWNDRNYDKTWSEALTNDENEHLLELLELMKPETPKNMMEGHDGAWFTFEVTEWGKEKQRFSWWTKAPDEWESVEAVYRYVTQIAGNSYSRFLAKQGGS